MENIIWYFCLLYISIMIVDSVRIIYETFFIEKNFNDICRIPEFSVLSPITKSILFMVAVLLAILTSPLLHLRNLINYITGKTK